MVRPVHQVWTGQAVRRALMERQAVAGLQVRTALMGLLVHPVLMAVMGQAVPRELLEQTDQAALRVRPVLPAHREVRELMAVREPLLRRAPVEHREAAGLRLRQAVLVHQGHPAPRERPEVVVLMAQAVAVAVQEHPHPQDHLVHPGLRALLLRLDLPVQAAALVLLVRQGRLAPMVLMGQVEVREHMGHLARLEAPDLQERLALTGHPERAG